jgi:PleD family two-component response regulator
MLRLRKRQSAGSKIAGMTAGPGETAFASAENWPASGLSIRSRMQAKSQIVLLIDDGPSDRYIFRRFLEAGEQNLTVLEACNAAKGLQMCREVGLDCVILDYKLPDSDGLILLDQLRTFSEVPVVLRPPIVAGWSN